LLMGTRWGDPNAQIQAAVGDPGYAEQTGDPLSVGVLPPIDSPPDPGTTPAPETPNSPTPPPPGGR